MLLENVIARRSPHGSPVCPAECFRNFLRYSVYLLNQLDCAKPKPTFKPKQLHSSSTARLRACDTGNSCVEAICQFGRFGLPTAMRRSEVRYRTKPTSHARSRMARMSNAVHVFFFECPDCGFPFPNAIKSDTKKLEEIDACGVWMECRVCQWAGPVLGINATHDMLVTTSKRSAKSVSRLKSSPQAGKAEVQGLPARYDPERELAERL